MISGADQDFRIISRMMAQIKAVGVLRSRPVYGILLWKKKRTKRRERKNRELRMAVSKRGQ
jgi:hypothetical protein